MLVTGFGSFGGLMKQILVVLDEARLSVSNYFIVEPRLVRHLSGAHLQLVVGQAHRAQERVPPRVILNIR